MSGSWVGRLLGRQVGHRHHQVSDYEVTEFSGSIANNNLYDEEITRARHPYITAVWADHVMPSHMKVVNSPIAVTKVFSKL